MPIPDKKAGLFTKKKVARLLKRPLFVFLYTNFDGRRKVNKQKKAAKNSGLVF